MRKLVVLVGLIAVALVGCSGQSGAPAAPASTSTLVPEERFNSLFLTFDELGSAIGQPISDYSETKGQSGTDSSKANADATVPCNLMDTFLVSEFVYGSDFTRYRTVSQSIKGTVGGQMFYTVALYPDEAKSAAAFQRLADGFHACRWQGGNQGWFSFGEDTATKLTWTSKLSSTDQICAHVARLVRNLIIADFTCFTKHDVDDADKIGAAIEAKVTQ
ncbi:sensor domain-containing protein [Mycobacteroides abscessus]|uniref:sensor domain-containing protein n=1 Tax=Mycobacteroides abscessus TaxID=36809 RepID=UPI0015EBAF40|nr:sensor domain-containing protein [Mycobacteroides abscessus]